jgi:TonB family protein
MLDENNVTAVLVLCTLLLAPAAALAADARPAASPPGSLRDPIVPPGAGDSLPLPDAASGGDEELPPVSKGEFFSERQIRYCLAEGVRIDAVRKLLNRYNHAEVRRFNGRVADFNARCSSYRFYGDALQNARLWLDEARPRIEQAAREAHAKAAAADVQAAKQASNAQQQAQPQATQGKRPGKPGRQDEGKGAAVGKREVAGTQPPLEKPLPVEKQQTPAPPAPAQARAEPRAEPPSPLPPAPPAAPEAPPASVAQAPQEPASSTPAATAPGDAVPSTAMPSTAQESAAAAPPLPVQPPQPAPPAAQDNAAAVSDEGRQPAPDVATGAVPSPAPSTPTTGDGPNAALERLTKEVRSIGSMVLDRPSDGKSGDVTAQLEVRYAEGGYINSIVVAESSGTPALDEQALAVARALRLPNAPPELRAQAFAVRFPVVFRGVR